MAIDFLANPELKIFLQILFAAFLGGLVGVEREYQDKEAGLRTCTLVAMGAALFTTISLNAFNYLLGLPNTSFDPSRVIGQIVLGIGFIGAGLIVYRPPYIRGLTTAAGVWVVAAIGVAVGVGFYILAFLSALLTVAVFYILRLVEERIFKTKSPK